MWDVDILKFHATAAWTFQRVTVEGKFNTENPVLHHTNGFAEVTAPQMVELFGILIGHGIQTVIAQHIKTLFGNMNNQLLYEFICVCGGLEQDMEKGTVFTEVRAKFFCDGKDNMSVSAIDEFEGNGVGTVSLVSGAAGVAESGMTAERDELVCTTVGTLVKCAAEIRVTTADNLSYFRVDNGANI